MKDRFTRTSRTTRGSIPKSMRLEVYERDDYRCQFCGLMFEKAQLTIDHLVPISKGGLDEITNWVTACSSCNARKANTPFAEFVTSLGIAPETLPVHGDPIIDNADLPIEIRVLRKRIYDRARRRGKLGGKSAQRNLEKAYRREFWTTPLGKRLEAEWPQLPGQVRIMIPEIETIAKTPQEYLLLIELAKSAATRNLIGSVLNADCDVLARVTSLRAKGRDEALVKRLEQALTRYERALRQHHLHVSFPDPQTPHK